MKIDKNSYSLETGDDKLDYIAHWERNLKFDPELQKIMDTKLDHTFIGLVKIDSLKSLFNGPLSRSFGKVMLELAFGYLDWDQVVDDRLVARHMTSVLTLIILLDKLCEKKREFKSQNGRLDVKLSSFQLEFSVSAESVRVGTLNFLDTDGYKTICLSVALKRDNSLLTPLKEKTVSCMVRPEWNMNWSYTSVIKKLGEFAPDKFQTIIDLAEKLLKAGN